MPRPLVTLLLGIATTLFIAWPVALLFGTIDIECLRPRRERYSEHRATDEHVPILCECHPGLFAETADLTVFGNPYFGKFTDQRVPQGLAPSWATQPILGEPDFAPRIATRVSGWPVRAMACEARELAGSFEHRNSWSNAPAIVSSSARGRDPFTAALRVPLRPIWSGFLIDSIFYAAAWWSFLQLLTTFRRRRRARKNLCPYCAYDLRATALHFPCPECGRASTARGADSRIPST